MKLKITANDSAPLAALRADGWRIEVRRSGVLASYKGYRCSLFDPRDIKQGTGLILALQACFGVYTLAQGLSIVFCLNETNIEEGSPIRVYNRRINKLLFGNDLEAVYWRLVPIDKFLEHSKELLQLVQKINDYKLEEL